MPNKIASKIEEILADDRNFGTRTGLRFTLELVKDAFDYIEGEKIRSQQSDKRVGEIEDEVKGIKEKLDGLISTRTTEQAEAKDERKYYRRLVVGGIITIIMSQIALYLTR